MRTLVKLLVITMLALPFTSFVEYAKESSFLSKEETQIYVVNAEFHKAEDLKKLESMLQDQSKFFKYKIRSGTKLTAYTDVAMSEGVFADLLADLKVKAVSISVDVMTKTEYYKKHSK